MTRIRHARSSIAILTLVLGLTASAARPGAQADDPKAPFLAALGRFSVALEGAFGDEGRTIRDSVDEMERALHRWDADITAYEAAMRTELPAAPPALAARMHLALGGVYLDRGRSDDAVREFSTAARTGDAQSDALTLLGVTHRDVTGNTAAATDAFTRATIANPGSLPQLYLLISALTAGGRATTVAEPRQRLIGYPLPPPDAMPAAPFVRAGLVTEIGGLEPFFPPVLYADGYALLLRGDLAGAIAQFRGAAAHDPLVTGAGAARGFVERAGLAMRDGRVSDALQQLADGIQLEPELAELHRVRGFALAADDRLDEALLELRRAAGLAPADERTRLSLAQTLIDADRLTEAADVLTIAIRELPKSGGARYRLARVRQRQGRYPEAIAALSDTLRFNPMLGVNSIYDTIGALETSRQNFAGAIEAYRARVALIPNDADAHQRLGEIYARAGRDDEALMEYHVALLLRPASAEAFAAVAGTDLRAGRYTAAAEAARRALTLDMTHQQAHYVLGTALVRSGQAADGRAELATFERLQNEAAAARVRQLEIDGLQREATVSAAAGDETRAASLLRRAVTLDPESAPLHMDLGIALLQLGDHQGAVAELTQAAMLGAPFAVHQHLAAAYETAGRADDSRRERALYQQLKQESLRQRTAGR